MLFRGTYIMGYSELRCPSGQKIDKNALSSKSVGLIYGSNLILISSGLGVMDNNINSEVISVTLDLQYKDFKYLSAISIDSIVTVCFTLSERPQIRLQTLYLQQAKLQFCSVSDKVAKLFRTKKELRKRQVRGSRQKNCRQFASLPLNGIS